MAEVTEVNATLDELLGTGRRNLAVRDYNAATESLAKACELLAKEHGEMGDACGEAYLWYGKALLGLSREENGVLVEAATGDNNEEDDNEENDETEEDENEKKVINGSSTKAVDKTEPESTTKDDEPGPSIAETSEAKPGTSNGETNDDSTVDMEAEDVDNLQHAWVMLELSRKILQKRIEDGIETARPLLADVYLALGEVALESETYDKAVTDMMSCLEIQKELYKSDDRRIAETHYQIGLANSLASNFDDAVTHFKNAANILESRIKTLENPISVAEDSTVKKYFTADPLYSVEAELKELKDLLPEIQEKIQDMMDYKSEMRKRVRELVCPFNVEDVPSSSTSTKTEEKPAANISHLVKRKRKNSDDEMPAAKKVAT